VKRELVNKSIDNVNIKFPKIEVTSFSLEEYEWSINVFGIEDTWSHILSIISINSINSLCNTLLNFDNLSELYEIGLALSNKIDKKEMGKYYTPTDVASVMAELLLENDNISELVDVGCGTGNLVVEVIKKLVNKKNFDLNNFILNRHLWLYDMDKTAIDICVSKIEMILGYRVKEYINIVVGDFLSKNIVLPKSCTVITNPPYCRIKEIDSSWDESEIIVESKDLYSSFMDKITNYCKNAVIVSPQSYLVADKFASLRTKLSNNFYGEIFSFDNVPGTLFNGRKHGIFNTNSSNGVRASITSIKKNGHFGFKLTHLIRFKTEQRNEVINLTFLRSKLGESIQDLKMPVKSFKIFESFIRDIFYSSNKKISDLLEMEKEKQKKELKLIVSSSARYYILGSKMELDRNGFYTIFAKDIASFNILYSLLNSSYIYMWWRFLDGGILFSKRNLLRIPINEEIISKVDNLDSIITKMINSESKYLTYKKNAGKAQESIKFPIEYRDELNKVLFPEFAGNFELLHNNFEVINVN
jgi:hypothetical protein